MKRGLVWFFLVVGCFFSSAQRDSKWILGETLTPDSILAFDFSNGQVDTIKYNIHLDYFVCSANISDTNGNLLFATNGLQIMDRKGDVMSGAGNLEGTTNNPIRANSIPNGCIILPVLNSANRYILLHEPLDFIDYPFPNFVWDEQPLHLYYSVIDMNLGNGFGEVVANKNAIPIITDTLTGGRLAACKHANGRDWWILTHEYYSKRFYRLVTSGDSVIYDGEQMIGSKIHWQDPCGQASFSVDGSKYAMVGFADTANGTNTTAQSTIELYDFDRCTGLLSNFKKVKIPMAHPNQECPGGCSFSTNGRFLYVSSYSKFYQYDLQLDELLEIIPLDTPLVGYFKHHQLAPDGKIYICSYASQQYLQTISNPDVKGQGCNFKVRGYELTRWNGTIPTFSNYNLGVEIGSGCDTLTGITKFEIQNLQFQISPSPATDQLNITINETLTGAVLNIYNLTGALVQTEQLLTVNRQLSTVNLPSGVYIAKLKTKEVSVKRRWVKM